MKILAMVGAAMTGGNTDKLTDAFIKGAHEAGHEVKKIHMGEVEIAPCLGCNICKKTGKCAISDDMEDIGKAFLECDMIVIATPLYFWTISAQTKTFIDRLYALGEKSPKGYYAYPIKKCALLATCADSDRHFWPFELVEQYYRRLVRYMKWEDMGMLTCGGCGGTVVDRCIQDTGHLEDAYQFGLSLK